tara:strand:- start:12064 stop:12279 length:216 start_codon:yes stop_codon:yes gene_type:complete
MKKFNFEIVFICANSEEQKTIIKEYKAIDYIQAKRGIKNYCMTNKTYKTIMSLRTLKYGVKSVNLMHQDNN